MECARCGMDAILELRYFKERLCGRCFCVLFERRLKRSMRVGRLLGKRDIVVVGLSGGRDSMVLLSVFSRLFCKAPRSRLVAVTVDDGMRGRVKRAVSFCRSLGVEHFVCPAGRSGVWGALAGKARSLGADKLALGGCLDDEVVSVLEGIMKGRQTVRASSVAGGGIRVIRPLREFPSEEVGWYARINGISFLKAGVGGDCFRRLLGKMVDDAESLQPGSKFRLLKSADCFMDAAATRKVSGR
ncbi:MAG: ATP-binding protein [Candidatus Altiarchaeota archaeon]|nr:ATP-binding protein [Candidatus Altiarchaeota archaeon]